MNVRAVRIMLVVAVVIDVAYWATWFTHRSWVESDTSEAYVAFENAFPLADAWLGLTCVLALIALGRRSPSPSRSWHCAGPGPDVMHCSRAPHPEGFRPNSLGR